MAVGEEHTEQGLAEGVDPGAQGAGIAHAQRRVDHDHAVAGLDQVGVGEDALRGAGDLFDARRGGRGIGRRRVRRAAARREAGKGDERREGRGQESRGTHGLTMRSAAADHQFGR
jgi:hypothetical protein